MTWNPAFMQRQDLAGGPDRPEYPPAEAIQGLQGGSGWVHESPPHPPPTAIQGFAEAEEQGRLGTERNWGMRGVTYAEDPRLQLDSLKNRVMRSLIPGDEQSGQIGDEPNWGMRGLLGSLFDQEGARPPAGAIRGLLSGDGPVPPDLPPATAIQGLGQSYSYEKEVIPPAGWSGRGQHDIALEGLGRSLGRLLGLGDLPVAATDRSPDDAYFNEPQEGTLSGVRGLDAQPAPIANPATSSYWDSVQQQPGSQAQENSPDYTLTERTFVASGPSPAVVPSFRGFAGLGWIRPEKVSPVPTRGLGSLGQWWNPFSWAQVGYTAATDVENIYNEVQNLSNTVGGDLDTIANWLNSCYDQLNGLWATFNSYYTDFLSMLTNVQNYLADAGAAIDTIRLDIEAAAKNLESMLETMNQSIATLVTAFESTLTTLDNFATSSAASWTAYMTQFEKNFTELQTTQTAVATDLHMLRSHFDNYASLITNTLEEIDSEMAKVPDITLGPTLSLPALPTLAGLGEALGLISVSPGGQTVATNPRTPVSSPPVSKTSLTVTPSPSTGTSPYVTPVANPPVSSPGVTPSGGSVPTSSPSNQSESSGTSAVTGGGSSASAGTSPATGSPSINPAAIAPELSVANQAASSRALVAGGPGNNPGSASQFMVGGGAMATPGGIAPSNVPPYSTGPYPYSSTGVSSVARAVRLMAQTGVVASRAENLLNNLTALHITTLPQLVSAQVSTNATLQQIHAALQAQNAMLAAGYPAATSTPSATSGLGRLARALGESVYVVESKR